MQLFLLTDYFLKAAFIQRGLLYENLSAQLLSVQNLDDTTLERTLFGADGLFIYFLDKSKLETWIDKCLHIKNQLSIIVLTQELDVSLLQFLHQKKKIQNYFTRPFPFRLLAAEMRSHIFQIKEKMDDKILKIKNLELNRETREVKIDGKIIFLRNKEYALLEFFMMHPGKVLSREVILENVWDRNATLQTNTVDVHLNKLKKKIQCNKNDQFFKTVHCIGYIFLP